MPVTTVATDREILGRGGTVIAATHRLARHLRLRHDRHQAASGARAWPTADVVPLDAWLRRSWEALVLAGAPPGHHRLISDDESRFLWHRIISADDAGLADVSTAVPLVSSAWELCQAWGIGLDALAAAADTDDARHFGRWARTYASLLERRGWIDAAGLLNRLATPDFDPALAGLDIHRPLGFAGFDMWTPAQRRLADRLGGAGIQVAVIGATRPPAALQRFDARNPDEELASAFAWAAARCRDGAEPPAIVVPDLSREADRIRRIGLDVLAPGWRLDAPAVPPLAIAVGRQLADYPVVAVAIDLLEFLAGGAGFEPVSRLLRSPYITGFAREEGGRARAELDLRLLPVDRVMPADVLALLGRHAPATAARWQAAARDSGAARGGRRSPGQWAREFAGWLASAGWPGDRAPGSAEFQVLEAWQHLLEAFAATADVAGDLSVPAALALLRRMTRDRPFEPEAATGAIPVLSLREAVGQEFPALWVCGLTADRWPPPARPHALVPFALQQSAGIPAASVTVHAAVMERRFEALLAAAPEVVLSWPAEREEAATLPSPWLSALAAPALSAAAPALHADRDRVAASAVAETVADDPPPPLAAGERVRGGVRLLDTQSACPARAFVEFRLGGAPLEPPARPLDPRTRGSIVHAVLEGLYGSPAGTQGLGHSEQGALRNLFDTLASQAFATFVRSPDAYARALCQLERERLWQLVLSLRALDLARPPFSVRTEVAGHIELGPLPLQVRFDRIDVLEGGARVVIDYKTGSFRVTPLGKPRPPACQLLLYAVAGEADGVAVIELHAPAATLTGYGAPAALLTGMKPASKLPEGLDWQGTLVHWRQILEVLAAEFAAGDFRVDPRDRRSGTGQYAAITRIHEAPAIADDDAQGDSAGDGGE